MKLQHLLLFVTIVSIILTGCNKEDELDNIEDFGGFYQIAFIQSSQPIDMNNDGLKTIDVLGEISNYQIVNGEPIRGYYNPGLFLAEVRPLPEHTFNKSQLISFNFPYQIILNEESENPLLMCYTPKFTTYIYNLTSGNTIDVTDFNPEYTSQYGTIHSVKKINPKSFEVNMSIRLYDFTEKKWIDTEVVVGYNKN